MNSQIDQEVSELRKEIAELKSELTFALSKVSDKLAIHSENHLELRAKIERLSQAVSLEEEQVCAEVQHESGYRNTSLNPAD